MSRICPLFSGSSGNCVYIGCRSGGIIIDAGVSAKRIAAALDGIGVAPETLSAVVVTHTHTDHIAGIKTFTKRFKVPVFASQTTLETLKQKSVLSPDCRCTAVDKTAAAGDFLITRFDTDHDCPGSSGFRIDLPDGSSAAVCTDLGAVTDVIRSAVSGVNAVVFESNHDVNMLQKNPSYPYELKQRILSSEGHLSNTAAAAELPDFVKSGTTRIILAHLSRENNLPTLAASAAKASLIDGGMAENEDYILSVAAPSGNGITVF